MEKRLGRIPVVVLTVMAAVVTYILRHVQLQRSLDLTGKIMAGAGKGPLTWLCIIFVVLAAAYCIFLQKRPTIGVGGPASVIVTLVAAFLMALGSAVRWNVNMVLALGGFAAAVCWVAVALVRRQGKTPSAVLLMLPALFYAVELIIEFRGWSRDPLIMDYCFDLFALICVMCATFHLGGFCLETGARRLTVFFSLCGVFFSAAAIVKTTAANALGYGAAILWLLANLWLLLRTSRKREEEPAEETEEVEAPAESEEETEEPAEEPEEAEEEPADFEEEKTEKAGDIL